jgi:hypothetical protein
VDEIVALRKCLVLLTGCPQAHQVGLGKRGVVAVFGRYSRDLVLTVAEMCHVSDARHLVISGNQGKDSGQLVEWAVPEAHYVLSGVDTLRPYAISQLKVAMDLTATDGQENATRMVELLGGFGFSGYVERQLIVAAHSTQMVRLGEIMNRALADAQMSFESVRWTPSTYTPSLDRWQDRREICFEVIRLAEMQEAGEIDGPPIPDDLLAWAPEFLLVAEQELAARKLPRSTAGLRSF